MGRKKREPAPALGYKSDFAQAYQLERELGKGGNGVVRLATQIATGTIAVGSGHSGSASRPWCARRRSPAASSRRPGPEGQALMNLNPGQDASSL